MTLRILAPTFVAGVCFLGDSDRAFRVAPIVGYMRGWTPERVRAYAAKRGWTVEEVPSAVLMETTPSPDTCPHEEAPEV